MHHPYFEEWKAREEARRRDAAGREAWKLGYGEETKGGRTDMRERAWRVRLRVASLRICVSFRWGGHPER